MKAAMTVDEMYPEEHMSGHVLREARERGAGDALRAAASFFHASAREDPDVAEYMEEVAREVVGMVEMMVVEACCTGNLCCSVQRSMGRDCCFA